MNDDAIHIFNTVQATSRWGSHERATRESSHDLTNALTILSRPRGRVEAGCATGPSQRCLLRVTVKTRNLGFLSQKQITRAGG
eukprot:9335943-Pyramimonas_sp.AAC.1